MSVFTGPAFAPERCCRVESSAAGKGPMPPGKGASMRRPPWIALGAVAAIGLGVGLLVREQVADAAPVRVTSAQLLINQRISQAGVRRSNEALNLLLPIRPATGNTTGWATANILNGAITNAKLGTNAVSSSKIADAAVGTSEIANNAVGSSELADNAVGNSELANNAVTGNKIVAGTIAQSNLAAAVQAKLDGPLFAVIDGGSPSAAAQLVRGNGATGVARQAEGVVTVSFNQNVTGCAYAATAGDTGSAQAVQPQLTSVSGQAGNPNGVLVRTSQVTGGAAAAVDTDFHLVVTC